MTKRDEVTQLLYDMELDKALDAFNKGDNSLLKQLSDPEWEKNLYTQQIDGGALSKFYAYCTGKTRKILAWNFSTSPDKLLVFMVHEDQLGHGKFIDHGGSTFQERLEKILGYTYKGKWQQLSITEYAKLTSEQVVVEHPQCFTGETMAQFVTPAQLQQLEALQRQNPEKKLTITRIMLMEREE